MNPDRLAQMVAFIWQNLELAAQGAYSTATSPNASQRQKQVVADKLKMAASLTKSALREAFEHFVNAQRPSTSEVAKGEVKAEMEEALVELSSLVTQALNQTVRAIRAGHVEPVTVLIDDKHGGMANLIAQRTLLRLTVRDTAGRQWKEPSRLAMTIARGFGVQTQVILTVEALRQAGHTHAYVAGEEYPLHEISHMRTVLFHPNSKEVPRVDLPA